MAMPSQLEPRFFRRLAGILASLGAIYIVFLAFLLLFQRHLMYFPDKTPFNPAQCKLEGFAPVSYQTDDGFVLKGFYAPPVTSHRLSLVFFHGNAGHLCQRAAKIQKWRSQGYGVMLAAYRGFHANPGSPTEPGLYSDARAAIKALEKSGIQRKNMVFYGESLGTGIAVQMATEGPSAAVVLDAPYTSLPDVGAYRYPFVPIFWIMEDKYLSINKIKNIKTSLLVLQAGKDFVIPPHFARKLYEAAEPPKKILLNPSAGHNTIYASDDIVEGIFAFLRDIEARPAR